MNKKGFTLIELIGSITLIVLISIIILPPIMSQIAGTKQQLSDTTLQLIYDATQLYIDENGNNYPKSTGNVFCVSLQRLIDTDKLSAPLKDFKSGENISLSRYVRITITSSKDIYELMGINDCTENIDTLPNKPVLTSNMIPIIFDTEGHVKKADINTKWYDYSAKVWANAIVVKNNKLAYYKQIASGTTISEDDILMYYVWIPRFKYSIPYSATSGTGSERQIAIKFEIGTAKTGLSTTATSASANWWEVAEGEYMTHPAFSSSGKETTGFWIGKFETGYLQSDSPYTKAGSEVDSSDSTKVLIKPNIPSWRKISLVNIYNLVTGLKNAGNIFGFVEDKTNIHVLKNDEWGAVAYLAYSRFGSSATRNNNNVNFITGCAAASFDAPVSDNCDAAAMTVVGKSASTNIDYSGVYDMSGGAREVVMGNYTNGTGTLYPGSSGFALPYPDNIYYNKFAATDFTTACNGGICFGQALSETSGWDSDKSVTLNASNPWLTRGGYNTETTSTGIFNYDSTTGEINTNTTFRIAIIND